RPGRGLGPRPDCSPPAADAGADAGSRSRRTGNMTDLDLALWGPSAAGKTALLAQLFLLPVTGEGWEVFPTEASLPFIEQMQTRLQTENLFPEPSTVGNVDKLLYHFVNRKLGTRAALRVEDRAGLDSEQMSPEWQQRLNAADGLVLLFDPVRERVKL